MPLYKRYISEIVYFSCVSIIIAAILAILRIKSTRFAIVVHILKAESMILFYIF